MDEAGVLTFVTAPDFEDPADMDTDNEYIVEISVTDRGDNTTYQIITVKLVNVQEITSTIEAGNFLSPNGDGKNELWKVANVGELNEYNLYIFNNIGELLYETISYNNTWDATYNGKSLPSGTYYYMFVKEKDVFKGSITIVR